MLDVGSGGGFPGLPLALLTPERKITLLDASEKKTAFLQQVCQQLALNNVTVVHARVEQFSTSEFDTITCRAFSDLASFVVNTEQLLADGGQWLAMKGKKLDANELKALGEKYCIEQQQLQIPGLADSRHLVIVSRR